MGDLPKYSGPYLFQTSKIFGSLYHKTLKTQKMATIRMDGGESVGATKTQSVPANKGKRASHAGKAEMKMHRNCDYLESNCEVKVLFLNQDK